MKKTKWDFLVYVHAFLLAWAILFIGCLFIPGGAKMAGTLAVGNFFFLFVNIPLAIFSFILKARDRFSVAVEDATAVLSVLNILIGMAAWIFVIVLLRSPKFG